MIGIGALGLAVAERLIAANVTVYGYRRSGLEAFAAAGGTPMDSAQAVAGTGLPVILLLPSDAALAEVIQQIAPALQRDQRVLCLGSHTLGAKQEAAAVVQRAGASMLDGEISGTPAMLRAGRASVMLAGDSDAAEQLLPLLHALSSTVKRLGSFGNATKMKLVTNYLVGVHTLAAAEALRFAERLGLDLPTAVDTVTHSAGGSTMLGIRGPMMAQGQYPPGDMTGFIRFFDMLRAALHDRGAGGGAVLDLTEASFRRAVALGFGHQDIAAIYESLDCDGPARGADLPPPCDPAPQPSWHRTHP